MRTIVGRVGSIVDKAAYDFCESFGCFDIAARKKKNFVLLKTLENIDSFEEEQANSLKIMACNLDASAMLIGERTRREKLKDDVIYQRYGIPAINASAFENVLSSKMPAIIRRRGGCFIEIDAAQLREKRQTLGITQSELAKKAGTTKKSIYEHEKANIKASKKIVDRLEAVLGNITVPAAMQMKSLNYEKKSPRNNFETIVAGHFQAIGFETSSVYRAPCNIIAKSVDVTILSEAEEDMKRLEKMIKNMSKFAELAGKPILAVTKEDGEFGIPTISEKDLRTCSEKDIKKIIQNKV
jgi:putative transcriptional regulator